MMTNYKKMQALQWNGEAVELTQVKRPSPQAGEVLIKVACAGICNTDIEIARGYYPFTGTLGHEFVGTIIEAEKSNLIGKRVVSDINLACHHCKMCKQGHPHHCLHRQTLGINSKNGAFAELVTLPLINLTFIPDSLVDEQAVFAEPLAAALEILEQVNVSNIEDAAVIGDGKLGLLIALCLHNKGLNISLLGHHPQKYALLNNHDIQFFTEPPQRKFPLVIEATGNPAGFEDALQLTQAKGILVLKSTYAESFSFNPASLVVNEITLLGSRCGPMEKAIALMVEGNIKPECLIEDVYSLKNSVKAFTHSQQRGSLKILIKP